MLGHLLTDYEQCFYVTVVFYTASLLFLKVTLLLQYYRIFSVQTYRRIYIGAIVLVSCWGISQLLIGIFMCTPIAGFWDKSLNPKCIPNFPQYYINAAGNIITDIMVFVLPMPVIKHLNLPQRQRILLYGIFSIGFL